MSSYRAVEAEILPEEGGTLTLEQYRKVSTVSLMEVDERGERCKIVER